MADRLTGSNVKLAIYVNNATEAATYEKNFYAEVDEITVTPTMDYTTTQPLGQATKWEQYTGAQYDVTLRGGTRGDALSMMLAEAYQNSMVNGTATPLISMNVIANGKQKGKWTAQFHTGTYRGGPLNFPANNAPGTIQTDLRFQQMSFQAGKG